MQRRFRRIYPVRYDETDMFGYLTPAAALRYMQDIAGLDSAEANLPGSSGWLAKRSIVEFIAPVPARASLDIQTYALGFTRVTAQRAYDLRLEGQLEVLVKGRTLWVYLDERGKLGRIPDSATSLWLPDGPQAQLVDPPFPLFPNDPPFISTFSVRFSELDLFAHMNNAAYVAMLDDAGWEALSQHGFIPTRGPSSLLLLSYDIDYLDSAVLRDKLEIHTWFQPNPRESSEFVRLQKIWRDAKMLVRAVSRWRITKT